MGAGGFGMVLSPFRGARAGCSGREPDEEGAREQQCSEQRVDVICREHGTRHDPAANAIDVVRRKLMRSTPAGRWQMAQHGREDRQDEEGKPQPLLLASVVMTAPAKQTASAARVGVQPSAEC